MRRNEPIHRIMTREVFSVHIAEKPSKVRQLLDDNPFQHVPIVNGEKLVGIVSAKDIAKLSLDAYVHDKRSVDAHLDAEFSLEQLMTPDPECIDDHATVRKAAEILAEGPFHALPVVDKKGLLKGMVTSTDLLRYLVDQY